MKKLVAGIVLAAALAISSPAASAGGYHHSHGGWGWAAPAFIAGTVAWAVVASQPRPVYVYSSIPGVVVAPAPVVVAPPPSTYEQRWVYDPSCNCYRQYMVVVPQAPVYIEQPR